jgi:hypothetical protein
MVALRIRALAPGLIFITGAPAAAQEQDQPSPPALRGPTVPKQVASTIVRRDAKGNLQRVEGRPEEAALVALDLDEATRQRARDVVLARAMTIGGLLVDNIDLVRQRADDLEAGRRDQAAQALEKLYQKSNPEARRSPLLEDLRPVLSPERHTELTRLVDDYWTTLIDWELRRARDKSEKARLETERRLALGLFQEEVRRAYEGTLQPYRQRMDEIFRVVDPTPEQRTAIRSLIIEHIRESRLKPTAEQRRRLLGDIYRSLDAERQAKLFDLVVGQL